MSAPRSKYVPPATTRDTDWTAERIGALSVIETKQLRDNALRLGEDAIAAICEESLTRQRRQALAARKALPAAPARAKAPKAGRA
jgi:hypothetical protein